MNPVEFKEQNTIFNKPQNMTDEECCSLPAYKSDEGIISCWQLSLLERIKILFKGQIWLFILSENQPPVWIGVDTPFKKS